MKLFTSILVSWLLCCLTLGAQTVVINTGTAGTPEYAVGPVYMSPTLFYKTSRYAYLYTQTELSAVGITSGASVVDLGWMKNNANSTIGGGKFRIYLKNSAASAYSNSTETWVNLNTGSTLVYENLNQVIPATAAPNYIVFPLTTPFVYTGGSLEISVEWDITQVTGTPATGAFDWVWSTVTDRIYGMGESALPASLSSTTANTTIDDRRPFLQITTVPSTPCAGAPLGGTANASAAAVCPSTSVSLTVTGSTIASGLTYQWQSSPDAIVWTNIAGATNSTYTTTLTQATNFRRRVACATDSAFSTVTTVGVNSFLSCYCSSAFTNAADEKITNVTIGAINNTTTGTVGGPVNYTAQIADVIAGNTHSLSVSYYADGGDYVRAYIDWNQNGVLNDAGEVYVIASGASAPGTQAINIAVPNTAITGNTRLRVMVANTTTTGPCISTTYGEAEDYTLNVLPPPVNEAGITAITRPGISPCALGSQIWVNLQNLGSAPLTQANFALSVNGTNIPVANPWTGSIASGATQEVQVPVTYTLADNDSITVTVSLPNGQVEDPAFAFNNQKGRRVRTSLSGNKTVGTGGDYANLNVALQDLYLRGVCDTVYFKVAAGTYNTQHIIAPYTGAGPGKLVVIESATGNAADVVYSFPTVTGANYVFRFNGSSYYSIRNLSLKSTGTTYASVVDITNNAHHLEFGHNILSADTTYAPVNNDFDKIILSTNYDNGTDYDYLWIHDNQFIGAQRSMDFEIEDGELQSNIVIENNTMSKFALLGLLSYNTSNIIVRNNTITGRVSTGSNVGLQIMQNYNGGKVSKNNIEIKSAGAVIYLIDIPGGTNPFEVSNNFLYSADSSVAGVSAGIGVLQDGLLTGNVLLANNSISFRSKNAANGAINILSGSSISAINNNVGSFGTAPALLVASANSIDQTSNNNFFGSTVANIGSTPYATLAALQGAGYAANSVSVNPGFNGTDLHTCALALNGAALPLAYVTADIDGDARSNTPDIGADEFVGSDVVLLLQDVFEKCPSAQVTLGNVATSGVTYTWTPSGGSSQITTANAGTYVVTATSSCGVFSDTAVVTNLPLPTASFTSATVGLAAIFTNTSTNGTSYVWDFGDGNSSTDANPTHVYASASTYSVSLTVTNECGTATSSTVQVNVINAGIEENASTHVSLFPNPTNGTFNVTFDGVNGSETVISVIDVTGKTILVKNIAVGVNQVALDATTFASGIYSVKVSNGEFTKVIRMVRK